MRKRGSKWILGVILLAGCLLYGQMTVSAKEQEPMTVETTRRQAKATGARLNFTNVKKEFNVLDYGASVGHFKRQLMKPISINRNTRMSSVRL